MEVWVVVVCGMRYGGMGSCGMWYGGMGSCWEEQSSQGYPYQVDYNIQVSMEVWVVVVCGMEVWVVVGRCTNSIRTPVVGLWAVLITYILWAVLITYILYYNLINLNRIDTFPKLPLSIHLERTAPLPPHNRLYLLNIPKFDFGYTLARRLDYCEILCLMIL